MRRQGTFTAFAVGGLVATVLLHVGAFAALPVSVRIVVAFAALVLLPGCALLAALRLSPPGGSWLAAGWALGLGVAWLGAQVLCTRLAHVSFLMLAPYAAVPNALLWLLPAWRETREEATPSGAPALGAAARAAVLAAALLAGVHVARVPTPAGYRTDTPDHVGTIRRMMAGGDAFPEDAFFRDAGPAGVDPRKGLWHPGIATIATLAHADPLDAWRTLAALLAPLFVLNAAAFAFLLGGSVSAAIGAWALVLTYGGALSTPALREAVFATKLADQLALATVTAVLADLETRRTDTRLGAALLALGAVAAHVFAALQFAIVFGALGAGLLLRERGFGRQGRRLAVTAGTLGFACLPYLLWRMHGAYAPANPIHTEPQGLVSIAPGVRVVAFEAVGEWFGLLWLAVPLSCIAWARGAARPAVLFLLTTSIAVALVMFCPPVVALLQPRLGYLLMRIVWLLPLSGVLAFAIPALGRALRDGGTLARAGALLAALALAVVLVPVLREAADVLVHPAEARAHDERESVLRWRDALAGMSARLPERSVVLADPATSYSIPMLTRFYVATLTGQHSSPNDAQALARIVDARDALDPASSWDRVRDVIRRRGVTAIALNGRFAFTPRLEYWAPSAAWFRRERARLDAEPAAFVKEVDRGDFVVYAIRDSGLAALASAAAPRPDVFGASVPLPAPLAHAPGVPDLLDARLVRPAVAAGESGAVVLDWHATGPLSAGEYAVIVDFLRPWSMGSAPPAWLDKAARKWAERVRRERYRFRVEHLPAEGAYGVDAWRPTELVRDSFAFEVPEGMAPGDYSVEVSMVRRPHYPIHTLAGYLSDRDDYRGTAIGTLRVTGARGGP